VADLDFYNTILMTWLPPESKLIEIYATNVSSLTINPRIGYRHKLLNVQVNGSNPYSSTIPREAIDITTGPKTVLRYPIWLFGQADTDADGVGYNEGFIRFSKFLSVWVKRNVLDLLPDAAADETLTLSFVSGSTYPVLDALYAEYPSDQAMAHDVPGGSDYWRKFFVAYFYLLSTTVGNGQQLSEYGEPFGMSLLGENGTIPPNKIFHQFGIASGYPNAAQNNGISKYTTYNALHEWKNDEELFTPDTHAGLYINQESSLNNYATCEPLPFELPRRVDFNPNDRLKLYADVTTVTGSGGPLWVTIDGILEDLSKKPAGAGTPA